MSNGTFDFNAFIQESKESPGKSEILFLHDENLGRDD